LASTAGSLTGSKTLPPALAIRNLRVDYGDFTAVDELSLEIQPGEIFGLAGANGAGKTTTMRVLATLLEPTYGDVEICGIDSFGSPQRVHALIGYMPDLAPVVPDLKVWEFLDLYAHSYGFRGGEKRDRVDRCLDAVGLADSRDSLGRGLSRGMMQRVVLAKTLLHDPRVLLLDEPASGMDPIARRELRLILETLAGTGAAVIVSSHILSELSGMCTRVGIMHRGRLMRSGSTDSPGVAEPATIGIRVELVTGAPAAARWLKSRDDVPAATCDGSRVDFTFRGGAAARAGLLRELLDAGFPVAAFTPATSGIESILLSVIAEDA
jgi:ABC-2 type transport system ATP-binding protein